MWVSRYGEFLDGLRLLQIRFSYDCHACGDPSLCKRRLGLRLLAPKIRRPAPIPASRRVGPLLRQVP